jgi:peptidoglycan-associated lipoprotein
MLGRLFAVATITSLAASVGCSHKQQVTHAQVPRSVAPRMLASAGPPKRVTPTPPVDTPKRKEGDTIFFDFDSALVRDDARPVLQKVAETLHQQPAGLRIEGNCDEVGTVEYNLALGEQRARAAKEYLVHLGVAPEKIATISYGSQRPKDPGHDDTAHSQNRRDDLVIR